MVWYNNTSERIITNGASKWMFNNKVSESINKTRITAHFAGVFDVDT